MFFYKDQPLQEWGDHILEATWEAFPTLAHNQIALTWLVYDSPAPVNIGGALTAEEFWKYSPRGYHYRGVESIYPASVVKLFYLVAIHEWLERDMVQPSTELDRAIHDMIVDSSNDATGLIVDALTGTTSGPELAYAPFETWKQQRYLINRYFATFGWDELKTINVCQKTWGDGPYGRERAFYGQLMDNRNMLTTNATARLLHSIVGGVAVSAARSQTMLNLMARSLHPEDLLADPENQVTGFLGAGLPLDAKLWSKAGLTSKVRHDAAYIELPGCVPYLLVVYTEGADHAKNESILPFVSWQVIEATRSL
jgi:Beta-lactamase enzyme family